LFLGRPTVGGTYFRVSLGAETGREKERLWGKTVAVAAATPEANAAMTNIVRRDKGEDWSDYSSSSSSERSTSGRDPRSRFMFLILLANDSNVLGFVRSMSRPRMYVPGGVLNLSELEFSDGPG
jgi:hypothetical protein